MNRRAIVLLALLTMAAVPMSSPAAAGEETLTLRLRSRVKDDKGAYAVKQETAQWPAAKTALIVIDMWDDHWCKSAAKRVGELAGPMNEMLSKARSKGVLIVHSPSSVTEFYKDTPQRQLAKQAPFSRPPTPVSTFKRWGTCWCWPDAKREPVLPIDDSDMGCDCAEKCTIRDAWTREIATLQIADGDAISDDAQEVWNLFAQRGIDNVLICGVHLNMCVLGRPTGIRQMTALGKHVVLVRDMTDTMYNHERPPGVDHFRGTQLVVEHVEKYWCPSCVSTDLTHQPAFHFHEDTGASDGK